jgi:hypothetical protein
LSSRTGYPESSTLLNVRAALDGDGDGIDHIVHFLGLGLLFMVPLRFLYSNVDRLVRDEMSDQLLRTVNRRVVNRDIVSRPQDEKMVLKSCTIGSIDS